MAPNRRGSAAPPRAVTQFRSRSKKVNKECQEAFAAIFPFDPELSVPTELSGGPQSQPNPDHGNTINQPHTRPLQTTSGPNMGKQKFMLSNKRPRGGGQAQRGGRGGATSKGRSSQPAMPGPGATVRDPSTPNLKLKLGAKNAAPEPRLASHKVDDVQYEGEDAELPLPPPVTSRSGRAIHKPSHGDDVEGSDYDRMLDPSSSSRDEDGDDYRPHIGSDPPYHSHHAKESPNVLSLPAQQQKPKAGGPRKTKPPSAGALERVDEEDIPSSETIRERSASPEESNDNEVHLIMNALRSTGKVEIDLPGLTSATDPNDDQPYTAKLLTRLYTLSYEKRLWDICDLIVDTWIRAFHELRTKGQLDPAFEVWRPNKVLEKRKKRAEEAKMMGKIIPSEFDPNPPNYNLEVADPEIGYDVTAVNIDRLNELYKYTDKKCGARLLWADALVLGGDKTEKLMEKCGHELHKDLVFNTMQTSLRMMRRKLTLKIEESTEGAWCKRYHEHSKHGEPCYREKASREAAEKEDEQTELDIMAAFMESDHEQGTKRGFEDVGDAEMSGAKRVRFGGDEDSDGDSEEE
ncbi:hypothetical protein BDW02DRAFT_633643 [Decorospora gaudefroyi]|uniref:Uncharacterized protein n=1 Tax=Decorospora gaudefroyi TaxID=184978 RepID=A0A6A5K6K9_9PLEO|nr:hypothetical protein BDW02DRAFT_633643 [Decorospora gaudefroyi]